MKYLTPRIPDDARLAELTAAKIDHWFRLHVGESLTCECGLAAPGDGCEVGESLFRLSLAAKAGRLDRRAAA